MILMSNNWNPLSDEEIHELRKISEFPYQYPLSRISNILSLQTNLLTNPGFELSTGGVPNEWTSDEYDSITDTTVGSCGGCSYVGTGHNGGNAVQIKFATQPTTVNRYWYQTVNVTAGTQYTLSGWITTSGMSGTGGATFQVDWADSNGNWLDTSTLPEINTDVAWTLLSGTVTAPANAATADVEAVLDSAGTAVYDDMTFSTATGGGTCGTPVPGYTVS